MPAREDPLSQLEERIGQLAVAVRKLRRELEMSQGRERKARAEVRRLLANLDKVQGKGKR